MGSARDSAPDPKWAGSPVRPPPSARLRLHPVSTITPAVQAHIDDLGERPRAAVNALFRRLKVPAQMVGIGSLFNIHFTDESVVGYRAVARGDRRMFLLLRLALMNRGIIIALRGLGCIASVMSGAEVEAFHSGLEGAVEEDLELAQ